MSYNVAIIGAGLIGRKRAVALSKFNNCILKVIVDIDKTKAEALAKDFGGEVETDWQRVVSRSDIDIVIIATVNKFIVPISKASLQNCKHVLCEKPLGRNAEESKEILNSLSDNRHIVLKTGFNHRFHPALWNAMKLFEKGEIGKCLNIRARYGHGGRPGMEKEWRASKGFCGGGELLDQGVHIIDLVRWFGGEITEVYSRVETKSWDMEVEDNAFAILKTDRDVTASFHVSWTNWRNIFSFEVFGEKGYLSINGLGGSYGAETLEFGRRKKEGGRPDVKLFDYPSEDISWEKEWEEFIAAISERREPIGSGIDGLKANMVIDAMYESSMTNSVIRLQ